MDENDALMLNEGSVVPQLPACKPERVTGVQVDAVDEVGLVREHHDAVVDDQRQIGERPRTEPAIGRVLPTADVVRTGFVDLGIDPQQRASRRVDADERAKLRGTDDDAVRDGRTAGQPRTERVRGEGDIDQRHRLAPQESARRRVESDEV